MQERSLKVVKTDKTFFNKISNTLTKLLIPTRISFNSVLITIKRNNLIKAFEAYNISNNVDEKKKELLQNRYEEAYTLYLESIDKYIMDSVYKKVKSNSASSFERTALSKYYTIIQLKDTEYVEYKHKKQKFLLELDNEAFKNSAKEKNIERYNKVYIKKMDALYKGILKTYSVQLSDSYKNKNDMQLDVYSKIYELLEEYVVNILPLKVNEMDEEVYSKIKDEYDEVEKFSVGKLDERDCLEKNMLLLGISRQLFTHSLPLAVAEQCYKQLISEARELLMKSKNEEKKNEAYNILRKIVEEYNLKLLATKVYWENSADKEEYKNIWEKYNDNLSEEKKEIIFLKSELISLRKIEKDNSKIGKFYKSKLVEYGVMRKLKNSIKVCFGNRYIKKERV